MKSALQNWTDIRVFLAVVQTGSTLAASKLLGMSQPTVARRVDALEHALKLTLFERDTRGFHATAAARDLTTEAMAVAAAVEAFEAKANRAGDTLSKAIRFTAPPINYTSRLSMILSDFLAEHPGVRFEFSSTLDVLDLAAGEADVALRVTPEITDERLVCTRLMTATAALYAAPAYAEAHGLPQSEADFAGHRFVAMEGFGKSFRLNTWMLDRVAPEQVIARCSQLDALVASLGSGLGIGPVPTPVAEQHGGLIKVLPQPEGTEAAAWLVMSPDAYRRPEVRAFSAFFAPRFRALTRL